MKFRFFFWTTSLIAVFMISSCAPAATSTTILPTDAFVQSTAAPVKTSTPETTAPEPTQSQVVQAVATSRGPNLEATDPSSVNLASGQVQLIEFFRLT